MKQTDRPVNRQTRREKPVRSAVAPAKPWVKISATLIVLVLFLGGLIAGTVSR